MRSFFIDCLTSHDLFYVLQTTNERKVRNTNESKIDGSAVNAYRIGMGQNRGAYFMGINYCRCF